MRRLSGFRSGGEAQFELVSPGLRLLADEGQLEQALLALFHNAEQATADMAAPRLWVQARQGRGGGLQITMRDNGPGASRRARAADFPALLQRSRRWAGRGSHRRASTRVRHGWSRAPCAPARGWRSVYAEFLSVRPLFVVRRPAARGRLPPTADDRAVESVTQCGHSREP